MKHLFCLSLTFALLALMGLTALGAPIKGLADIGNWQNPDMLKDWQISSPQDVSFVKNGAQPIYLHVVSPPSDTAGRSADYSIPINEVRGSFVVISVDVRAIGVTQPEQSYNGIKVMLHVASPSGGDTWDQASANGPTFPVNYDWSRKEFQTMIPSDATSATLVLGLQQSAGIADFRNLRVAIIRTVAPAPRHLASGAVFTGHGPGALRGVMISPDIQPRDVATLKSWHVNVVRWQVLWTNEPNKAAAEADMGAYDAWLAGNLRHLDAMLPVFHAAGIRVVVDMHTPPGGRDANSNVILFGNPVIEQHFITCWENIARRYKNNRAVWGYDLMNEPVVGTLPPGALNWHDLAALVAARIRRIDPGHAIIVEPEPWASPDSLRFFEPLKVEGVVYSVHFYDPHMFTHQGVSPDNPIGPVYPGVIDGVEWNKDHIRRALQPAADYARTFHVSIYLGEFSAIRWAKGAAEYISDVIDIAEENHWDWTYHAFREWEGWSPEIGSDQTVTTPSTTPTDRLRVLQAAFARNVLPSRK